MLPPSYLRLQMIIGIDPSQRHTGVCILDKDLSIVQAYDIVTGSVPLLESGIIVREMLGVLFDQYPTATYSVEKMMPSARNGHHLFYIQMVLLEELAQRTNKRLIHPLPIQLKSFMKSLLGTVPETKTDIVKAAKQLTSFPGKMTSHVADAYFLARLGDRVLNNNYKYNVSRIELPIISWEVIGGRLN